MKNLWLALAALVIVIGGVWYFHSKSSDSQTIKIAALLSMTGDGATWGENAQKAIQLATEEVNQSGGINGKKVEVTYEDTATDPKKAVSAFQLATSIDHTTAVIGPLLQTEVTAIMPLIEQTGTPTIAPSYVPLQNRKDLSNPLFVWLDAQVEAERIAQYVYDQGIRKVAVVGTKDTWEMTVSSAFSKKFESLGGTITDTEIVLPTSADMRLQTTKIVASKPEAVFLGTYYQFVHSADELHNLGYQGKLYSIEVDGDLARQTSGSVSDLQFIAPDYYTTSFVSKFTEKYGTAPGLPAGQAYDAASILFSFLKKSTDKNELLAQMRDFKGYDGVSGKLQIAPDGKTNLPTALFDLKEGMITREMSLP